MASLAFLSTANAHIVGFAAPSKIEPGTNITFESIVQNDVQTYLDVVISVGLDKAGDQHPPYLGLQLLGTEYIGAGRSNVPYNLNHVFPVPARLPQGAYVLTAQYLTIAGASHEPQIRDYYLNVELAGITSDDYVETRTPVDNCLAGAN